MTVEEHYREWQSRVIEIANSDDMMRHWVELHMLLDCIDAYDRGENAILYKLAWTAEENMFGRVRVGDIATRIAKVITNHDAWKKAA